MPRTSLSNKSDRVSYTFERNSLQERQPWLRPPYRYVRLFEANLPLHTCGLYSVSGTKEPWDVVVVAAAAAKEASGKREAAVIEIKIEIVIGVQDAATATAPETAIAIGRNGGVSLLVCI